MYKKLINDYHKELFFIRNSGNYFEVKFKDNYIHFEISKGIYSLEESLKSQLENIIKN